MTAVVTPVREHTVLADARGTRFSRHQRDRTTWRLVAFSMLALALMVVVGLVAGARLAERQALDDARRFPELLSGAFVDPETAQSVLEHDEDQLVLFDQLVVDRLLQNTSVRRVKVWSTDGEVLYSSDETEIGKIYELSDAKREALRTNRSVEEVSDLEDSESHGERPLADKLIEVYDPVRTKDGHRVLFET